MNWRNSIQQLEKYPDLRPIFLVRPHKIGGGVAVEDEAMAEESPGICPTVPNFPLTQIFVSGFILPFLANSINFS